MRVKDESPPALMIHVGMTLKDVEKLIIEATLRHTSSNIAISAKMLGIDRSTLYAKIEKYSLQH